MEFWPSQKKMENEILNSNPGKIYNSTKKGKPSKWTVKRLSTKLGKILVFRNVYLMKNISQIKIISGFRGV